MSGNLEGEAVVEVCMRRIALLPIVMAAVITSLLATACTQTCDDFAIPSEAFVELPPGWAVTQLCVDSNCAQFRTLEIGGDPGTRPYHLDVVDPNGATKTFDGVLSTYVVPAGRSCGGPGLQGRISVHDDGSVTTS